MVNVGKYASPMDPMGYTPQKTIPVLTTHRMGGMPCQCFRTFLGLAGGSITKQLKRRSFGFVFFFFVLLMDEILHHLGWLKPYKYWDNHHPWWCRILSINSINQNSGHDFPWWFGAQWFWFRLDPRKWKGLLLRGTPRIPNHRAPKPPVHPFTISWKTGGGCKFMWAMKKGPWLVGGFVGDDISYQLYRDYKKPL